MLNHTRNNIKILCTAFLKVSSSKYIIKFSWETSNMLFVLMIINLQRSRTGFLCKEVFWLTSRSSNKNHILSFVEKMILNKFLDENENPRLRSCFITKVQCQRQVMIERSNKPSIKAHCFLKLFLRLLFTLANLFIQKAD